MPIQLLPASAAAFAPRSTVNVVLPSKVEPWLTQTLKRVIRVKRPLNNVQQHTRCLTDTLSGTNAIWSLCSIMVPKAPDSKLTKDPNPLVEAICNYQVIHIEAYVVHVDMVSQHEVAFKLTSETIEALTEYHKDIYSVDVSASTWDWPEKEAQLKKLQAEFVQAVNRYVFRTAARALEGMEDEGTGELLEGRGEDVKGAIMGLFHPLLPPPPRIVDVVRPAPLLPSSPSTTTWWPSQILQSQPAPLESWRTLSSTPSPTIATCGETSPPTGAQWPWSPCSCPRRRLPTASHYTPRVSTTVPPRPSPRYLRFLFRACWPSSAGRAPCTEASTAGSGGTLASHHSTPPSHRPSVRDRGT
jgi:hypothetical protein